MNSPRKPLRIIRLLVVCLLSLMFSHAMAQPLSLPQAVMSAVAAKDWPKARNQAAVASNPIYSEIVAWHALRDGVGSFDEYEAFLKTKAEWPGLPYLQARGEATIPLLVDPDRVIAYVNHNGVQTANGLVALMRAFGATGNETAADEALAKYSNELAIDADAMNAIGVVFPNLVDKYLVNHIDYLLFERKTTTAAQYLDAISPEMRLLVDARLAMLRDSDGINEAVAAIPPTLADHGGLAFDRMRYRYTHSNREGAVELMLSQSTTRERLLRPEYWAETRADMARSAMRAGNGHLAYELAANHFLVPEEDGYLDLEFLAGFAALEFLDDPAQARTHFDRLKAASVTPISSGRAGYWLGRAGDPQGYAYGARFQTSFYGQLAAEAGSIDYDQTLIDVEKSSYFDAPFMSDDNVNAALVFRAAGNDLLAHRFLAHLSESMRDDPQMAAKLGQLALDLGLPHAAVRIGKNIAEFGHVISNAYYPLPDFYDDITSIETALALAISRQESEFYPRAQSGVGARGLMQLMPATAQQVAGQLGLDYQIERLKDDPNYNIQLGTGYLAQMLSKWDGALPLAAVSYNAGPGRATSWQELNGQFGGNPEQVIRWIEMIPFDETRNYVHRVIEATFLYDAKLRGGFGHYVPSDLLTQPFPKTD